MEHDQRGLDRDTADPLAYRTTVRGEWIDYNGHMNVAWYGYIFDQAADTALAAFGLGEDYRRESGCSVFVAESHLVFDREVKAGAALRVHTCVLDADDRRLVLFQEMSTADGVATVATNEVLCVHVDLAVRRSRRWPAGARDAFTAAPAPASGSLARRRAGRRIVLARRPE